MQTATLCQKLAQIRDALPSWVPRDSLSVPENLSSLYKVRFVCPCHGRVVPTARIPAGGSTHAEMVAKLVAVVVEQHEVCFLQDHAAPLPDPVNAAAKIAALQGDKKALVLKKRQLSTANEMLSAKLQKTGAAEKAQSAHKRSETRAEERRLEIDPKNVTKLSVSGLSTAKTSPGTGIVDSVKYWAQGSAGAVLQLVMCLIQHFNLEKEVAAELQVAATDTNAYIVSQAKDALQILKQCESEEQREHYRVVLTALAPEKVGPKERAGMGRRVAGALGVNRDGVPFRDSVDKRAHIASAAKEMSKPLVVGDAVACRHGSGTLLGIDGPHDPCKVQIEIGDVKHEAVFTSPGKGEGGARLRRAPISFKHKKRSQRKDTVPRHVQDKVLCHNEIY
jgi:hypothetical protein